MENERYLTEQQVSELTGLALSTLRNKRHFGEEPVYAKIGRSVRYALSDVMAYMESRKVVPRNSTPKK